jgi:hypothetical protein
LNGAPTYRPGEIAVDWTPIFMIGFAVLMIADLLVFRMVLPPHTVEGTLLRVVNALSWAVAVFLLLFGFAWIFLWR